MVTNRSLSGGTEPPLLSPRWGPALAAAGEIAPAREWRQRLARAVCGAVEGAIFASVTTCPPGSWRQIEHDSEPERFDALIDQIEKEFVPRIERAGEGWRAALARYGTVYAPLDVAIRRPLAEELFRRVLAPEGICGYLVAYIIGRDEAILGFLVLGAKADSDTLLVEHRDALVHLVAVASRTLQNTLDLARGCGVIVPERQQDTTELTLREQEVAELAVSGLSNLNIAAELGITEETVSVHLRRIYGKLGVHSRVELATRLSPGPSRRRPPGR